MYALITGASSGLGEEFAKILDNLGYNCIIVARREDRLNNLKKSLKNNTIVYPCDLKIKENCFKLYDDLKQYDIRVFINNAGFGAFGKFYETNLEKNLSLLDVNVYAATILFNLYVSDFKDKKDTYILNVASAAAFSTGPLLGVYYASKSYLYKLSISTYEELRRSKSKTVISCLCPGPVKTEFDDVACVNFSVKSQTKEYVSKYAIKKMFKHKLIIIPAFSIRVGKFFTRFLSEKMLARIGYNFQHNKEKE